MGLTACANVETLTPAEPVPAPAEPLAAAASQPAAVAPLPGSGAAPLRPAVPAPVAAARPEPPRSPVATPAAPAESRLAAEARSPLVQPPRAPTLTPAAAKLPAAAAMDLTSLEARLKTTPAIGLLTKLALKNQIDDLLAQLRAHHRSGQPNSLAPLRTRYEGLMLKVLALLQDTDPPLAGDIAGSREEIWAVLSNPAKFATVAKP
jgi:hypothetical protein